MAPKIECPPEKNRRWRGPRYHTPTAISSPPAQLGSPEFHRDLRLKSCILQILAPRRCDPRRLMGNPQVSADSSIVLCHINPYHISKMIKLYQRKILMSFGYKSDRPKKLTRGRCCRRWDNIICVSTSAKPISFRLEARLQQTPSLTTLFFWRISRSFGGKRGLLLPLTLGFFATWGWAWWSSWGKTTFFKVYHWVKLGSIAIPTYPWHGWKIPQFARYFPKTSTPLTSEFSQPATLANTLWRGSQDFPIRWLLQWWPKHCRSHISAMEYHD